VGVLVLGGPCAWTRPPTDADHSWLTRHVLSVVMDHLRR
jgi:hypothetical protein